MTRSLGPRGDGIAVLALARESGSAGLSETSIEHVQRLVTGLVDAGMRSWQTVGLFAPNRPEVDRRGAGHPRGGRSRRADGHQWRGDEVTHLVRDSGTRRIFTADDHARHGRAIRLDRRPDVCLLDAEEQDSRSWRRLFAVEPRRRRDVAPTDGAALFYTAGTTGRPTRIPLTHANCVSN